MPIVDKFRLFGASVTAPAEQAEAVTASDTQDLARMTRAVYVGTPGDLRVTMKSGETITLVGAPSGWHPLRASRVWATGTTAANIVAFS